MKSRVFKQMGLVGLLFTSGAGLLSAQEAARSSGTPIIFSESKSPSTSSNLTELRKPQSPFRNLESELKRPFEVFDNGTPQSNVRPTRRVTPPPQNKKSVKDMLNQQAEDMYLSPELYDEEKANEAFFQLDGASTDPYKQKPRNSLDRYYDRIERNRQPATNRFKADPFGTAATAKTDPFGLENKLGRPSVPVPRRETGGLPTSSLANPGLSSDNSSFRSFSRPPSSAFSTRDTEAAQRSASQARMENFKRLLAGPRASSATQPDALTPGAFSSRSAARPSASPTITPSRSTSSISAFDRSKPATQEDPHKAFVKSAGLVGDPGKPQGLPEFDRSVGTPTAVAAPVAPKPRPVSTFKLPKRRI
jgi:hypothetical protein